MSEWVRERERKSWIESDFRTVQCSSVRLSWIVRVGGFIAVHCTFSVHAIHSFYRQNIRIYIERGRNGLATVCTKHFPPEIHLKFKYLNYNNNNKFEVVHKKYIYVVIDIRKTSNWLRKRLQNDERKKHAVKYTINRKHARASHCTRANLLVEHKSSKCSTANMHKNYEVIAITFWFIEKHCERSERERLHSVHTNNYTKSIVVSKFECGWESASTKQYRHQHQQQQSGNIDTV